MLIGIKKIITILGLKNLSLKILKALPKLKKNWRVNRDGIWYHLDISKTVDFGIFLGGWEADTIGVLKKYLAADKVVCEVGANIGAHTLLMAKLVSNNGQVIAIEPTEFALRKLRNNIGLNPSLEKRIKIFENVVSDKISSSQEFLINSDWSLNGKQNPEKIEKSVTTLDTLLEANVTQKLDLLKVDVDGFDLKVLKGAVRTIRKFRPIIFVELCDYALHEKGDSVEELINFLKNLNYELHDPISMNKLDSIIVSERVGNDRSINGLFLPL